MPSKIIREEGKLERCLFYYTHNNKPRLGFGMRRYDCYECEGTKVHCKLYQSVDWRENDK